MGISILAPGANQGVLIGGLQALVAKPPVMYLGLLGDSRCAECHSQGGTRVDAYAFAGWVEMLSRGRVRVPASLNFGNSGDTSAQVLARAATAAASSADAIAVICGINDPQTAYPASIASVQSIVTTLLAAGKIVFLISDTPKGTTSGGGNFTGSRLAQHIAMHNWAHSLRSPNLYIIDCWPDFIDQAGSNAVALSSVVRSDNLHPQPLGAYYIGSRIATILNQLMGEPPTLAWSNADAYDATYATGGNLVANPLMTGSGGTLTGSGSPTGAVATSWTLSSTASFTTVGSLVTSSGKTWQQVAMSGTPINTSQVVSVSQAITVANINTNDLLEAVCEIDVNAGATEAYGPQLVLTPSGGSSVAVTGMFHNPQLGYGQSPNVAHSGVIRTPQFTALSGLTGLSLSLNVQGNNGQAGSMTFRCRGFAVRKV